jgi:hypothetical protein
MYVAVIGSAGRGLDAEKVSLEIFETAIMFAEMDIENLWRLEWKDVTLVSGGAAFCDHIAVRLFLKYKDQGCKLVLCLPAPWDPKKKRFSERFSALSKVSCAQTANMYHRKFADKTNVCSLMELDEAISNGATVKVSNGFFGRNATIANMADYMCAFTFGEHGPKEGGTCFTWQKFVSENKIHHCLETL